MALSRRSLLCSGAVFGVSTAGCSTEERDTAGTHLGTLTIVNSRSESHDVHIAIETGDHVTHRNTLTVEADTGHGWSDGPTGPFERETLYAWVDDQPRSAAATFEFGDYSKECVALQVLIEDSGEASGEPRTSMFYSADCETTESEHTDSDIS
jgi:hypothetical protein